MIILKRLKDKVVLVTGSGRGFGRAMALAYAIEGASVVAVARTISELKDLKNVVKNHGGDCHILSIDLSKIEDMVRLRDTVDCVYGRLDVLVNNAATFAFKVFDDVTIDDWEKTMAVNLRAPFVLSKLFFPMMKRQGKGSIINISSKSAEIGFIAEIEYCPSKYGIEGFTQCLALELKTYNIAVNSLNVSASPGKKLKPGGITLSQLKEMKNVTWEQYADDKSMVEAFSDAWVFLAMQDASGITGQRFVTRELAEYLKKHGVEAALANWKGKLTKAIYVTYNMPEKVVYQTPKGEFKELILK
jgi:NAD(P)-dependent dehydrogenase (short-subunit alcohol dehydrogenase family)